MHHHDSVSELWLSLLLAWYLQTLIPHIAFMDHLRMG